MRRAVFVLLSLSVLLSGGVAQAEDLEAREYLRRHEVPLPTGRQVVVCHGFGCKYRTVIALTSSDINKLKGIFGVASTSAAKEIRAIGAAVAWFERRIGSITGTSKRTPRAGPGQAGIRSEADCIDSTVNTTALLVLASDLHLLRHHTVVSPESRGYMLDFRYPHATAVVENRTSGARWAIDPWTKRNGERPDILPIEVWMKGS